MNSITVHTNRVNVLLTNPRKGLTVYPSRPFLLTWIILWFFTSLAVDIRFKFHSFFQLTWSLRENVVPVAVEFQCSWLGEMYSWYLRERHIFVLYFWFSGPKYWPVRHGSMLNHVTSEFINLYFQGRCSLTTLISLTPIPFSHIFSFLARLYSRKQSFRSVWLERVPFSM